MFDYVRYDLNPISFDIKENLSHLVKIKDIGKFAPLFWAEHCLECSPPACYNSCQLFEKNDYGRCKRLSFISSETNASFAFPIYYLKFKKWSKLRCEYNSSFVFSDASEFVKEYELHRKKIAVAKVVDYPSKFLTRKLRNPIARTIHHNYIKKAKSDSCSVNICEELVIQFYTRTTEKINLILDSYDINNMLLQRHVLKVHEGFNEWRVNVKDLTRENAVILALELYPADNAELDMTVFFSDLVKFKEKSSFSVQGQSSFNKPPASKVKCVAWDLDNTLWDGIVGEDGLSRISIRQNAVDVIKELDRRGILNTICSKNDNQLALRALDKFGLRDYFLYPQINWEPKSKNLLTISKLLNINIDTFAFVDDSEFERMEVKNALGCVRIFPDTEISNILSKDEFKVPVTEDSIKRRFFYMAEVRRQDAFVESNNNDYKSFIISCEFVVDIKRCESISEIDRCHELLMRTNQLNASTNRIPYETFKSYTQDESKLVLRVKCDDKYGSYGTVGCLIINKDNNRLLCTDFVISCRVAKKKVESAIIMNLMEKFNLPLDVVYRPSERNHVLLDEFLTVGGKYKRENDVVCFTQEAIKDYDWVRVRFSE